VNQFVHYRLVIMQNMIYVASLNSTSIYTEITGVICDHGGPVHQVGGGAYICCTCSYNLFKFLNESVTSNQWSNYSIIYEGAGYGER